MGKVLTIALVSTVLLLGNVPIGDAADYCLVQDGGPRTLGLILKGFSLPGKGVCKQTQGYYERGPVWISGMACASSDHDHITFFHNGISNVVEGGAVLFADTFELDRTSLSGPGQECELSTGSCGPRTWTRVDCNPKTVPVP